MLVVLLTFTFLNLSYPLSAGWLERKAEGWAWYEEDEQPEEEEIVSEIRTETAAGQLADARKQLEEYLAEAMLNPTYENTQRYMQEQQKWVVASAAFSQSWAKVLLKNPELDPTATTFATSQYGRQLQKAIENEDREKMIKDVAKEYGLFFFYEGSNKVSKAFSLVVQAFVKKYQWEVVGISMDGVLIKEIGNKKTNSSAAEKIGITIFPALVAVNPKTQEVVPIAFGLQSVDQIENNLLAQFKNPSEDTQ